LLAGRWGAASRALNVSFRQTEEEVWVELAVFTEMCSVLD
jgi:hypothetical protein